MTLQVHPLRAAYGLDNSVRPSSSQMIGIDNWVHDVDEDDSNSCIMRILQFSSNIRFFPSNPFD